MEPIHQAAWDGDVAALDRLVAEDGERLNARNQGALGIETSNLQTCTPLMLAVYRGKDAVVERLLALAADVGLQTVRGSSATHWACFGKQASSLALLLDAGASMTARDSHGRTPLMVTAEYGASDCVTLMLARLGDGVGEQLGMVDNEGYSAVRRACWFKHASTLALLLDARASMDARDILGRTPLMVAAGTGATDCVTLLLARLGDGVEEQLGMVDNDGDSAAHLACFFKQPSSLALLLDAGASMDARDSHERTPLMVAAEYGATDCVTLLLARLGDGLGEQLGMVDDDGDSAAHRASCFNRSSTLALLLDAGASMTARGYHGRTLLVAAAVHGATDSIPLLLEKGVHGLDLDANENTGSTALHLAAYQGYHQVISLLIHAGADPTIHDNEGQTPLGDAHAQGHQECVALLEAALVEPQRVRLLFKARALLDAAAHATHKARTDAQTKGHPAAVQQQQAMAAAPVYLKQRVAQAQELPRVLIQHSNDNDDDDEDEQLAACLKYALGLEGGGGVVLDWQEEPAVGMLPEVFVELLELLVPKWDPAQKGRPLGEDV